MITGSDEPGDVNDGSGDLLAETVDLLSVAGYSLRLKAAPRSAEAVDPPVGAFWSTTPLASAIRQQVTAGAGRPRCTTWLSAQGTEHRATPSRT